MDQSRKLDVRFIRAIGLLDEDRVIYGFKHREVVQTVADAHRDESVTMTVSPTAVAFDEVSHGLPLILDTHQVMEPITLGPTQATGCDGLGESFECATDRKSVV